MNASAPRNRDETKSADLSCPVDHLRRSVIRGFTALAGGVTRYTYNAQHRIVSITDPRGIIVLTKEYDANGRVSRQTQADAGAWQLPIGGTTGPLVATTSRGSVSRAFTVTTTGDFTLSAAPRTARVIAGDQTSVNIAAGGSGSFTSLVGLTVSTLPRGITASFSPSSFVAPGSNAFVNFAIATTVAPGSYSFTATGQAQVDDRNVTRTTAYTLQVLAPDTTAIARLTSLTYKLGTTLLGDLQ